MMLNVQLWSINFEIFLTLINWENQCNGRLSLKNEKNVNILKMINGISSIVQCIVYEQFWI